MTTQLLMEPEVAPLALELELGPPPARRLNWSGAPADKLDFMRRVYTLHVAHSARNGHFVAELAQRDLSRIQWPHANEQSLRRDAAAALEALLTHAQADLEQAQRSGDPQARGVRMIGVVSGYRSASRQFALWQQYFPRHYEHTAPTRATLRGGPHGEAAAAYLASYVGRWIAAPGYSNHNDGKAADLTAVEHGRTLGPSAAGRADWRRSWFFHWLSRNASRFDFYQNTSIDEPWHWEYRPRRPGPSVQNELGTSRTRPTSPGAAGRTEITRVPLLDRYPGKPPALVLRWNALPGAAAAVDVVVHFHGYARCGQPAHITLPRDIEPLSGLDFRNPEDPADATSARTRPTLGVLPRGTLAGPESLRRYTFPTLTTSTGVKELIDLALDALASRLGLAQRPRQTRLILTAHSGGGAALLAALRYVDPDEIHLFDALYGSPRSDYPHFIRWFQAHIRRDQAAVVGLSGAALAAYMRERGSALRAVYHPVPPIHGRPAPHVVQALELDGLLRAALGGPAGVLSPWYSMQRTTVVHCDIPRRYGWRLLANAAAALPLAGPP